MKPGQRPHLMQQRHHFMMRIRPARVAKETAAAVAPAISSKMP